jgi:hypothetical protein
VLTTHIREPLPISLYVYSKKGGNGGSSVETLRGTKGADFENAGRINRGSDGFGCGCLGGLSPEDKDRYILVKGPFIFVFTSETSDSPKYAIGLQNMGAKVKQAAAGSRGHVLLETNMGEMEYELSFATGAIAQEFAVVVMEQSATAASEAVRKRLGHDHLLNKRSSVVYAETVALQKVADQPDAPVSTQEILSNIPLVNPL